MVRTWYSRTTMHPQIHRSFQQQLLPFPSQSTSLLPLRQISRRPDTCDCMTVKRTYVSVDNRIVAKPGRHDVFINHRGVETKRNVASLLYHHLKCLRLRPFLDCYSMKPGDVLHHKIREAVLGCKVGVTVFSPRYCESVSCLRELALLMDAKKKVIPIFCDVKPSQLRIVDDNRRFYECTDEELLKFGYALDEATGIVGLSFDSSKGDWSTLLKDAGDAIMAYI